MLLVGVALVRFCLACHDVQSCMERLIRTLKLHGNPAGCLWRWTHIGLPWQLETAWDRIAVLSAGNRPVGPSSGLANSLGLTSPWVEHARACIGESRLIPSDWKIKGGHVYSYSYTNYALWTGAYIISILESNWLVLKIYVNLYVFFSSKCVVITPLGQDYTIASLSRVGLTSKKWLPTLRLT